jgi:hypothetical protein
VRREGQQESGRHKTHNHAHEQILRRYAVLIFLFLLHYLFSTPNKKPVGRRPASSQSVNACQCYRATVYMMADGALLLFQFFPNLIIVFQDKIIARGRPRPLTLAQRSLPPYCSLL